MFTEVGDESELMERAFRVFDVDGIQRCATCGIFELVAVWWLLVAAWWLCGVLWWLRSAVWWQVAVRLMQRSSVA